MWGLQCPKGGKKAEREPKGSSGCLTTLLVPSFRLGFLSQVLNPGLTWKPTQGAKGRAGPGNGLHPTHQHMGEAAAGRDPDPADLLSSLVPGAPCSPSCSGKT